MHYTLKALTLKSTRLTCSEDRWKYAASMR